MTVMYETLHTQCLLAVFIVHHTSLTLMSCSRHQYDDIFYTINRPAVRRLCWA